VENVKVLLVILICVSCLAADETKSRGCIDTEKDINRHEGFLKDKADALAKGPIDLVFIGDSITDGWRWGGGQAILYEKEWGKYNPYNIGVGGDETEHVLWRIHHGELDSLHPKLAVLLIGTNNFANQNHMTIQETVDGVHCVVKAIKEKLPDTKILLLGIFPRGAKSTAPFRSTIKSINQQLAKWDDGKSLKFLDIGDHFLDSDGDISPQIMPDALHPNAKGYQIWIDAMEPTLEDLMKQ
jgi:lysophospholipase L1-like esterase